MNEQIKTEKKPWQKPELVVLLRSKPDEVVLTVCKQATEAWSGPNLSQSAHGCQDYATPGNVCNARTPS